MLFLVGLQEHVDKMFLLFRHGARTTTSPNPFDPDVFNCDMRTMISITGAENFLATTYDIKNPQQGNCSLGSILYPGYVQAQNIAYYLKETYPELDFKAMLAGGYLRSSFTERVLASLKAFLDVMESPNYDVHVADDGVDSLLPNSCAYYDAHMAAALKDEKYASRNQDKAYLGMALNYTQDMDFEWWMAQDEFEARQFMQMDMPAGVTAVLFDEANEMQNVLFGLEFCGADTQKRKRLLTVASGLLIKEELIPHFTSKEQMVVYAAHWETISPLIAILASDFDCTSPPYAAFMELLFITDDAGAEVVELKYNTKPMTLAACGAQRCSKAAFLAYLQTWALDEAARAAECAVPDSK